MTGVFSVVDDIIIAGCGANDTEAKTVLKEISFHGHVITKDEWLMTRKLKLLMTCNLLRMY